jgi:hypothetical protein
MKPGLKICNSLIALSLLLQSAPVFAANPAENLARESADQAIFGLEIAPSTLPTNLDESNFVSDGLSMVPQEDIQNEKEQNDPLAVIAQAAAMPVPAIAGAVPLKGIDPATPSTIGDNSRLLGGVNMSPSEAQSKVDDLTRQILLKEIELERFNIHYNMEVARQGRWKGWRYAFWQEINNGLGLAGAIVSVENRGRVISKPKKLNAHIQEAANYIPMIGAIIGASAAAFELSVNAWHDLQAMSRGFSPGAAIKHVNSLKADINRLLAERDAVTNVEASSPQFAGRVSIDQCEGKVLKDLRDESLLEFERFHLSARKLLAFQQMQYMFDIAKYTTNAIGYHFAYLSLKNRRRYYNYKGGVFFTISGGLVMTGPILSRLFAKGVGEIHRYRLKTTLKEAEEAKVQDLVSDHKQLDQLCANAKITEAEHPALARSALYGIHEKVFQDEFEASIKTRNKAKLTATQNIGSGLFVGGCKIASGVLFIVPGHNPRFNGKTPTADRVTNNDLFTASVIAIPATTYTLIDNLRIQVMGEINRHKQAKEGQLSKQLLQARLAQLDDMEARLKKGM